MVRVGQLNKKIAATQALDKHYDWMLPRWKGAVLTAVSAYTGLHFCLGIYNLRSLFASSDSALLDDLRTFTNHKSTGSVIGLESPKQSN